MGCNDRQAQEVRALRRDFRGAVQIAVALVLIVTRPGELFVLVVGGMIILVALAGMRWRDYLLDSPSADVSTARRTRSSSSASVGS